MTSSMQPQRGAFGVQREALSKDQPKRLQTDVHSQGLRFSYAPTPHHMQRPVFEQFPSPTNSSIDDSPALSRHHSLAQMAGGETFSPYAADYDRNPFPYKVPPIHEHPANFAPYAEPPMTGKNPSYPLATLPPITQPYTSSTHKDPQSAFHPSEQPYPSPTSTSTSSTDPKPSSSGLTSQTTFKPTYNPYSITGPDANLAPHLPGQVVHPNSKIARDWKHSLCEPSSLCCTGIFCPCVLYGKVEYRLGQKSRRKEATDLLGYSRTNGSCGIMALACIFGGLLVGIQHTRIRKQYQIEGSFGDDCMRSCFCCCCVLVQNEREVKEREEWNRRHAGPRLGAAGYALGEAMVYAPPPR